MAKELQLQNDSCKNKLESIMYSAAAANNVCFMPCLPLPALLGPTPSTREVQNTAGTGPVRNRVNSRTLLYCGGLCCVVLCCVCRVV